MYSQYLTIIISRYAYNDIPIRCFLFCHIHKIVFDYIYIYHAYVHAYICIYADVWQSKISMENHQDHLISISEPSTIGPADVDYQRARGHWTPMAHGFPQNSVRQRWNGRFPFGGALFRGCFLGGLQHQWEFQEPIDWRYLPYIRQYKAYVREYPQKIWPYMVQYLHFRILKFPLTNKKPQAWESHHQHIIKHCIWHMVVGL